MRHPLGSLESQEWRKLVTGKQPDPARDLAHYLAGEFQEFQPYRLTSWRPDSTGQQLSDREVSRLEVLVAMKHLPYRQRRVLELLYVDGLGHEDVSKRLHISYRTLADDRLAAIKAMIGYIYEWH